MPPPPPAEPAGPPRSSPRHTQSAPSAPRPTTNPDAPASTAPSPRNTPAARPAPGPMFHASTHASPAPRTIGCPQLDACALLWTPVVVTALCRGASPRGGARARGTARPLFFLLVPSSFPLLLPFIVLTSASPGVILLTRRVWHKLNPAAGQSAPARFAGDQRAGDVVHRKHFDRPGPSPYLIDAVNHRSQDKRSTGQLPRDRLLAHLQLPHVLPAEAGPHVWLQRPPKRHAKLRQALTILSTNRPQLLRRDVWRLFEPCVVFSHRVES